MNITLAAILAAPAVALAYPTLFPSNAAKPVLVVTQSQTRDKFLQALRSLKLSGEQQSKIQSIISTYRSQHLDSGNNAEQQNLRLEILAVLTPEQRKQLQAQLATRGATPPMVAKLQRFSIGWSIATAVSEPANNILGGHCSKSIRNRLV